MKKNIITLLLFLGTIIFSTPYYPNGIPSIGSLKGGVTFWGEDGQGNYIDGVSYGATYEIKVPNYESLVLDINISKYLNGNLKDSQSFDITLKKEIKDFTGNINMIIKNKDGKEIIKEYKGYFPNPSYKVRYGFESPLDFDGADDNATVTLELVLNKGKNIRIKLDKSVAKDLIFIAKQFPGK